MKKLDILTMEQFTVDEIMQLLHDAFLFSNLHKDWQLTKSRLIANLFFESSTRTHYSFVSAEEQLGLKVIDFQPSTSSLNKGESLYDTVKTFESIGMEALVIRHKQDKYFEELKNINIPIINGGDGSGNHPSQSLLDLYTIYEEFGKFEGLNLLIVGDIRHSRVAHSNISTFQRLGGNVKISGPEIWMDQKELFIDLDQGVKWADIVMLLRIQNERHDDKLELGDKSYLEVYGLTKEREKMMKDSAIIMHPAPVNRGVEIDDSLVECERSRIFKQMENGVYVRKAMIKKVFGEKFEDLN